MIKIGIIGSSLISDKFCTAVLESDLDVVLEANYSRSIERAKQFGDKYNVRLNFDSKSEMLKVVDMVYIATPNSLHYEDVKQALIAGVHVLVEKPMTVTSAQTEELFDLARDNNLVLVEAIKTCSMNTYQSGLQLLDKIGEVKSFRFNMMREYGNFPTDEDNVANIYRSDMDGGVVADLGSYALFPVIDFIYPNADSEDIKLQSFANNEGLDVDVDITARLFCTTCKKRGLITLSMHTEDNSPSYIYGTDGFITIDSLSQFNTIKVYDNNQHLIETINRTNEHLMASELKHTIELINSDMLESSIHNKYKSVKVAKLLEALNK
ncbi:Gfo/Idh/MocA family oxidoreductase [Mollicutes bacterium LVI A0078]|nr:Gfo/Idh/MocA family oxidoreductase [Mollicutes bacterium LVI A0075]WOO90134.1 Gfo/Idh/MocA family oxidoreductase [Mollicutes bacterium LVI A0078]